MKQIAIIGFGCAGYHGLAAIRARDSEAAIDVYSETNTPPYNPMLTTYYVSGKLAYEQLFPFGDINMIAREMKANILTNTRVTRIDCKEKTVYTPKGSKRYDAILIATGANALIPPAFAHLGEEAFAMRTVEDAVKLKSALNQRTYETAVVVGASMAGIKVAELLKNRGVKVTLADMSETIFPLAAYPEVAGMIEGQLSEAGFAFRLGSAITGAKNANGQFELAFADGSTSRWDLMVLTLGTRAALSFLEPGALMLNRGILVDESMESSVPGIFAAGDCAAALNLQSNTQEVIGLWANAGLQGRVAGESIAGGSAAFTGSIAHNITHFMDMDFIGIGDNRLRGERLTFADEKKKIFIEAMLKDGKPVGFNILNHYLMSGVCKSYFIKLLQTGMKGFTPVQRGVLLAYGVEKDFLDRLEERL